MYSFDKLHQLLNRRGESFNSLKDKGILTDYTSRLFRHNGDVKISDIAKVCRYFNVDITDVVELSEKPSPDERS